MKSVCFCNHCGAINNKENKVCTECKKKIKVKNKLLIDYLLDETEDYVTGNLKDSFWEKIKYIIKKYLYGVILTVTVVGGITANIIVRTDEVVVTEKPNVKDLLQTEYTNLYDLFHDFKVALQAADIGTIDKMLYQTYYKEEARQMGIDIKRKELYEAAKNEVFKNGYNELNEITEKEVGLITGRYCEPSHEVCYNLDDKNEYYNTYLLAGFYKEINGENKWIGKFDIDIYIVSVKGKFYILDFVTQHADPVIMEAHGDLSKVDYESQMDIYV